jgi:hypothetical protein
VAAAPWSSARPESPRAHQAAPRPLFTWSTSAAPAPTASSSAPRPTGQHAPHPTGCRQHRCWQRLPAWMAAPLPPASCQTVGRVLCAPLLFPSAPAWWFCMSMLPPALMLQRGVGHAWVDHGRAGDMEPGPLLLLRGRGYLPDSAARHVQPLPSHTRPLLPAAAAVAAWAAPGACWDQKARIPRRQLQCPSRRRPRGFTRVQVGTSGTSS